MEQRIYIGFKGKNNASSILVNHLSESPYLLTNSFGGVKKDIESLAEAYDCVLMFGIDKNLKNSVRIERFAEREGIRLASDLDLDDISKHLSEVGVMNFVSNTPTHYLCNEAYWFALQKYNGRAVFIHIPTIKNASDDLGEKMKEALGYANKF